MSKKDPVTEDINGIEVTDPYRWLEDSDDPEVQEWVNSQNKIVDQELKNTETFNTFSRELVDNFKTTNFSTPYVINNHYFYMERQPEEDQSGLYVKQGIDADPTTVFDPNTEADKNTVTIDYWRPSRSGQLVAYGISEDGDEMGTLYVKDVDENKSLSEEIEHCRYSSIEWLSDDSGFFYTRNPRPGEVPEDEVHMHSKVYFHQLGDDPDEDPLIFGEDRPKDDMIRVSLSPNDRYLGIQVSHEWTENDVFIYDTETEKLQKMITGEGFFAFIYFLADKVLMYTDYEADNSRILTTTYDDLFKPIEEWEELIPERDHKLLDYSVTSDKILAHYLNNAASEVLVFDHDGNQEGELPLPEYANVTGILADRDEAEFFYSVNSFTHTRTTYHFNPDSSEYEVFRQEENPLNPDEYKVNQEWCESADGTRVPMFIVHKKNLQLDGANPTILWGYGAHGISQTPNFSRSLVPWLERGGVHVVANVRGGGEFGKSWQEAGAKLNKPNTIDDFIACAEHLVEREYTSPEYLGSRGGSNGGPLVAAAALQRPELFSAVCAHVPVLDMARFHKFGMAARWIHEFGDPEDPEDLQEMLKWSPYHNVEAGKEYPSFLFTTAEKDTRVHPMHARKMAALLQEQCPDITTYIFTEEDAGHGAGKPIEKIVEGQAILLTFLTQELT